MSATLTEIRDKIAALVDQTLDVNAYSVETNDVQRPAVIVSDPDGSVDRRAFLGDDPYDVTLEVRLEVDVAGDWAEADRNLYLLIPDVTGVIDDNPTLASLVDSAVVVDVGNFGVRDLAGGGSVRVCSIRVEVYA